jgi:hypothetical protein
LQACPRRKRHVGDIRVQDLVQVMVFASSHEIPNRCCYIVESNRDQSWSSEIVALGLNKKVLTSLPRARHSNSSESTLIGVLPASSNLAFSALCPKLCPLRFDMALETADSEHSCCHWKSDSTRYFKLKKGSTHKRMSGCKLLFFNTFEILDPIQVCSKRYRA